MSTLFIEDIDLYSIKDYVSIIDKCEGHLDIYIHSNGGEVSASEFLMRKIKSLKSATVYISFVGSCAMSLVRDLKGIHPIILLENAYGVYHCQAWSISMATKDMGRGVNANFQLSTMPDKIEPLPWLSDSQNEIYIQGLDVYFNTQELNSIFK